MRVGSFGDATALTVRDGEFDYVDVVGERMADANKIVSEGVVLKDRWWRASEGSRFGAKAVAA